jgi:hypothetical protein
LAHIGAELRCRLHLGFQDGDLLLGGFGAQALHLERCNLANLTCAGHAPDLLCDEAQQIRDGTVHAFTIPTLWEDGVEVRDDLSSLLGPWYTWMRYQCEQSLADLGVIPEIRYCAHSIGQTSSMSGYSYAKRVTARWTASSRAFCTTSWGERRRIFSRTDSGRTVSVWRSIKAMSAASSWRLSSPGSKKDSIHAPFAETVAL